MNETEVRGIISPLSTYLKESLGANEVTVTAPTKYTRIIRIGADVGIPPETLLHLEEESPLSTYLTERRGSFLAIDTIVNSVYMSAIMERDKGTNEVNSTLLELESTTNPDFILIQLPIHLEGDSPL